MNLLLKSEQIKPVKFRIVSNNVQCADFQMLKDNFLISDVQKVNDSRLHRWLISVGQSELAEQIATQYPTSQSISENPFGFISLFFQEELHDYHSPSEILNFFKNNRYAVFVDLLQSNASLLLEYYHNPFQQDFTLREWLDFFNRFPSEPECTSIVSEIKRKIIPNDIRGFDVVDELLTKVRQREQVPIPVELHDFLVLLNGLITSLKEDNNPKNRDNRVPIIYKDIYNFLYERAIRITKKQIFYFITSAQFYIYQRIDYFETFKCNKEYYRSHEIRNLLIKARECTHMEEFYKETFIFIKEVNRLIEFFSVLKVSGHEIRRDIPQKYKVAYEFIVKYLMEFSSKDSFEYFVCQYLSTLLVKIK